MQKTNDVATLFQQFGGAPSTYRAITRQQQSQEASARWPLLSQIQNVSADVVPPVQTHEQLPATAARRNPTPMPAPAPTNPAPHSQWSGTVPSTSAPAVAQHNSASPLSRLARRTEVAAPPVGKPLAPTESLQEIFHRLGQLAPPSSNK